MSQESKFIFVYDRDSANTAFLLNLLRGKLAFNEEDVIRELKGKNLSCWCKKEERCHADILLAIANRDEL